MSQERVFEIIAADTELAAYVGGLMDAQKGMLGLAMEKASLIRELAAERSENKRMRTALAASESRLQQTLEQLPPDIREHLRLRELSDTDFLAAHGLPETFFSGSADRRMMHGVVYDPDFISGLRRLPLPQQKKVTIALRRMFGCEKGQIPDAKYSGSGGRGRMRTEVGSGVSIIWARAKVHRGKGNRLPGIQVLAIETKG